MRLRTLVGLGALCVALGATSMASAQQRGTRVYRAGDRDTVYIEERAPAPYAVQQREADRYRRSPIRPRFGIDATGGAFARGPQAAFGGLRARLGLQLGDWFSIYYMPTGLIGGFFDQRDDDAMVGLMFNSLMAEVTFFDMLQLAVGPSLDFIWGCTDDPQSALSCDDSGPHFGLDGRVAIAIGGGMEHGRGGLTLSADVHPTWYADDTVGVTVLGGIGVDMF
jgi:hypothetical protein